MRAQTPLLLLLEMAEMGGFSGNYSLILKYILLKRGKNDPLSPLLRARQLSVRAASAELVMSEQAVVSETERGRAGYRESLALAFCRERLGEDGEGEEGRCVAGRGGTHFSGSAHTST